MSSEIAIRIKNDIFYTTKETFKSCLSVLKKDLTCCLEGTFTLLKRGDVFKAIFLLLLTPILYAFDTLRVILLESFPLIGRVFSELRLMAQTRKATKLTRKIELYAQSKGRTIKDELAFLEIQRFAIDKVINKKQVLQKELDELILRASFVEKVQEVEDLEVDTEVHSNVEDIKLLRKRIIQNKFTIKGKVLETNNKSKLISFGSEIDLILERMYLHNKIKRSNGFTCFLLSDNDLEMIEKELIKTFMIKNLKIVLEK